MRRVLVLAATAALLCALPACSDDPKPVSTAGTGFRAAYEAATADYVSAARDTSAKAAALKGDEASTLKVYAELANQVDAVRAQFASLPTPAKVAPEVTAVVRLLSAQVTLLRDISPAVKNKDNAAVQNALTALSRSAADLAQARVQLDAAVKSCGDDCS